MLNLIVVSNKKDWPENLDNARVVTTMEYLMLPEFHKTKRIRVCNLCRSYRYQSYGHYVSLLAEARGHRSIPSIKTIEDFKGPFIFRSLTEEFDKLIQKNLSHIKSTEFQLSIYFGRNLSKRYERLCTILFNAFKAPLLRAYFKFVKEKWHLKTIGPIGYKEIPESHKSFLLEACNQYFSRPFPKLPKKAAYRYEMAILHNPSEVTTPSNPRALEKFIKAGAKKGLFVELITKGDLAQLPTYDALFIRETTNVNHHTFRFARRAEMEGMAVIDDTQSILKCSNKVFLNELLKVNGIPRPKTLIVNQDNVEEIIAEMKFPFVLKEPDGSFSRGVIKVTSPEDFRQKVSAILEKSDLVLAQEYLPTDYDWRVGILDEKVLFVCKYYMAKGHWQIVKNNPHLPLGKGADHGRSETIPVESAPAPLIEMALKASKLIGDSLYGIDIKEAGGKFYLIEINDNPNIDHGIEDEVLKNNLYEIIIQSFINRIERLRGESEENT
jgi:glutathione synthase/RimK-type ligase-like ATP-grasp enzyme